MMTSNIENKKTASLFQVIKAVLWSMLGVRGQKGYEDDIAKISLKQIVIAGIIGAIIFVFTVLTLVNLAIKYLS
jgi:hypothetical protein